MSQEYVAEPNSEFYLQWQAQGTSGGQWNGSESSTSGKFYKLDWWTFATPNTYEFAFATKQGNGQAYAVFATVKDAGSGVTYGARFSISDVATCKVSAEGTLSFCAGRLISDDPKIQINESTTVPSSTCVLNWTANGWAATVDGRSVDPSKTIPLNYNNADRVTVTVTDETHSGSTCAAYYGDVGLGENSGRTHGDTVLLDQSNHYSHDYDFTSSGTYTINLFIVEGESSPSS